MIDVTNESTLTLTQASRVLPAGRNGSKPHLSTLIRWIVDGVRLTDDSRVRLEAVRFGSKWVTSREAIARFVAALTPQLSSSETLPPPRTATQRERAYLAATRQLEKVGI